MELRIITRTLELIKNFPMDTEIKIGLLKGITKIIQSENEAEQDALSKISALSDAFESINLK